jgi:hypothetical protein
MNEHVHGIIFKDRLDARTWPPQKGQRKPLGLTPAPEEISALDGRSADELGSPATVQHVLEALDAAVSLRTEIDNPLRVRLGHLESANGELRSELAAARAAIDALQAAHAKTAAMVKALRLVQPDRKAEIKARVAAEVEAQLDALRAKRLARRAEQRKGAAS